MNQKIAFSSFVLFCFLAAAVPVKAQYSSSWWGVRAGVNLANETVTLPDNATSSFQIGLIGGLAYEHWFDDTWGFSASLLYDQKGVSEQYSANAVNRQDVTVTPPILYAGNDNYTLSYLEVPLVIKFAFGLGDIKPYVAVGPTFGFLMSASESTSAVSPAQGVIAPVTDLKSNLQSLDMGIYAGLGITDALYHGPMLLFDAGYAAGLTKIYKTVPSRVATNGHAFPDPIDPTNAKSGDLRIVLGAMWPL